MSEKLDNLLNKILEIKKQQITMQFSNPGDTAQLSNSETVEVRQEALLRVLGQPWATQQDRISKQ